MHYGLEPCRQDCGYTFSPNVIKLCTIIGQGEVIGHIEFQSHRSQELAFMDFRVEGQIVMMPFKFDDDIILLTFIVGQDDAISHFEFQSDRSKVKVKDDNFGFFFY